MLDNRLRFYIQNQPVRGDVVYLQESLQTIFKRRDYPVALKHLLSEMLAAAALLMGTFKLKGRLSIQAQGQKELTWAMAECDHTGKVRALAQWENDPKWQEWQSSADAFTSLKGGVLFVNIEPEQGERYQGIIPLEHNTLAGCVQDYYRMSVQIPTQIHLASSQQVLANTDEMFAGGLLIQLLPRTEQEIEIDEDLWPRMQALAETVSAQELTELNAQELLYRLFHEENVVVDEPQPLFFGCTCSLERCENALKQVGLQTVEEMLIDSDSIEMDCQFCNMPYRFSAEQAKALFSEDTRLLS